MSTRQSTVVAFVLDETGSMQSVQAATISGFNEYVGMLKKREGQVLFTQVQFNSGKIATVYQAVPVQDVPDLTRETYQPDNTTPLYDAVAQTIADTTSAVAAMGSQPEVLVVIMTDGLENASKEYTRAKLFELIKAKEAEGWTFAYLGANQDAWEVAESIGVSAGSSMNYDASAPAGAFKVAMEATADYLDDRDDAGWTWGLSDAEESARPAPAPRAMRNFFAGRGGKPQ